MKKSERKFQKLSQQFSCRTSSKKGWYLSNARTTGWKANGSCTCFGEMVIVDACHCFACHNFFGFQVRIWGYVTSHYLPSRNFGKQMVPDRVSSSFAARVSFLLMPLLNFASVECLIFFSQNSAVFTY